jgi:dienelactone hydrolase
MPMVKTIVFFQILLFVTGASTFAWTQQSTFKIETGSDLSYVIAAPKDPASTPGKLPILIFEDGDGTANLMLNDVFAPPLMVSQLEKASAASGVIWAIPQLRRQFLVGQELQICSLDFLHRERDLNRFVDQMKQLAYVDSSKIFLIGHSAGGDTVTHVAQERNDIRAVINLAGGLSSCSEDGECPPNLNNLFQYQCSADQDSGRTGDWWKQLFIDSRLYESISSLSIPYLALIGDQDAVVSPTVFQKYSAMISKTKPNFESAVLPGQSHGSIKTSPQAMQMMLQFVNQNLQ